MTNAIGTGGNFNVAPVGGVNAPAAAPAPQAAAPAAAQPAEAAQPAAAINWDPAAVNLNNVTVAAQPPMWPVGDKPIEGRTFADVGDPHETTGDGLHFDNMKRGEFVKLMSATGDFVLQTRQLPWERNNAATVNQAAAVQMGDDLVLFDNVAHKLTINGSDVPFNAGSSYKLPSGGSVDVGADGVLHLVSPKGDKVDITVMDTYLNITGELSANRKDGEVRGLLGAFDNDTTVANDLLGRTGSTPIGDPNNADSMSKFLEEWRLGAGESLFDRSEDMRFFNNYLDKDGNGVAEGADVTDYVKGEFDINGDGKVTRNELLVARAARRVGMAEQHAAQAGAAGGAGPVGGGAPGGVGAAGGRGWTETRNVLSSQKRLDRNNDGKVTAAEYFAGTMGWDVGSFLARGEDANTDAQDRERALQKRRDEALLDQKVQDKKQADKPEPQP
jgi:hypothetical protein